MRHVAALALFAGIVLLTSDGLFSQEKKDPPAKFKGMLPAYYGKLGLSDAQKQEVYKVMSKYRDDVKKLEDKIAETRAEERKEINKMLTPEQRKKLEEAITGEKSPDPK